MTKQPLAEKDFGYIATIANEWGSLQGIVNVKWSEEIVPKCEIIIHHGNISHIVQPTELAILLRAKRLYITSRFMSRNTREIIYHLKRVEDLLNWM